MNPDSIKCPHCKAGWMEVQLVEEEITITFLFDKDENGQVFAQEDSLDGGDFHLECLLCGNEWELPSDFNYSDIEYNRR